MAAQRSEVCTGLAMCLHMLTREKTAPHALVVEECDVERTPRDLLAPARPEKVEALTWVYSTSTRRMRGQRLRSGSSLRHAPAAAGNIAQPLEHSLLEALLGCGGVVKVHGLARCSLELNVALNHPLICSREAEGERTALQAQRGAAGQPMKRNDTNAAPDCLDTCTATQLTGKLSRRLRHAGAAQQGKGARDVEAPRCGHSARKQGRLVDASQQRRPVTEQHQGWQGSGAGMQHRGCSAGEGRSAWHEQRAAHLISLYVAEGLADHRRAAAPPTVGQAMLQREGREAVGGSRRQLVAAVCPAARVERMCAVGGALAGATSDGFFPPGPRKDGVARVACVRSALNEQAGRRYVHLQQRRHTRGRRSAGGEQASGAGWKVDRRGGRAPATGSSSMSPPRSGPNRRRTPACQRACSPPLHASEESVPWVSSMLPQTRLH